MEGKLLCCYTITFKNGYIDKLHINRNRINLQCLEQPRTAQSSSLKNLPLPHRLC